MRGAKRIHSAASRVFGRANGSAILDSVAAEGKLRANELPGMAQRFRFRVDGKLRSWGWVGAGWRDKSKFVSASSGKSI